MPEFICDHLLRKANYKTEQKYYYLKKEGEVDG